MFEPKPHTLTPGSRYQTWKKRTVPAAKSPSAAIPGPQLAVPAVLVADGWAALTGTADSGELLAGGGFRHGAHLAFDTENNYPLSNLYVSMLQRLGLEVDQFSTGNGTLRGLEMVG